MNVLSLEASFRDLWLPRWAHKVSTYPIRGRGKNITFLGTRPIQSVSNPKML